MMVGTCQSFQLGWADLSISRSDSETKNHLIFMSMG